MNLNNKKEEDFNDRWFWIIRLFWINKISKLYDIYLVSHKREIIVQGHKTVNLSLINLNQIKVL